MPSTGVILAGTPDGLFRSTDNGRTWIERSVGLRSFAVTSFGASADGLGLPTRQIRTLAVAADGDVYVAAGPTDLEAYATGRDTNAGVRGIFKGHIATRGR